MKLNSGSSSSVVASQGVGMTSTFGIANNSHMFNILSSGLYADKIGAVLREVGCNAMDAHIFGKQPDKPFQVKLPTELDRSFYIKDWGPGLDDDEIKSIYTVYGISTKQQCEDQTGGFGLGSKSPFAYTLFDADNPDGFTIVSVKNGKKRIYVAHLNDEGAPAVSDMGVHDADPDWPSGVQVTFPVQNRDIREFHAKAHEIFRWFRVPPEILGLSSALQEPKFQFDGSFFKMGMPDGERDSYHQTPAVVMANVRYPIEVSRLQDVKPTMKALLSCGIHLYMDNGEVLMTPSRESLQYTDKTRKSILSRLERAAKEVAYKLRDDVMQPEATKLAWYRKVHTYVQSVPYGVRHSFTEFLVEAGVDAEQVKTIRSVVAENVLSMPKWVGDGAEGTRAEYLRDNDGNFVVDGEGVRTLQPGWVNKGCRVWMYKQGEKGVRRQEVYHGHVNASSEKPTPVVMNVLADSRVYYADTTSADPRVRSAMREATSSSTTMYLVVPCRGVDPAHAKAYAERMGGDDGIDGLPVEPVSVLPVPSKLAQQQELRRLRKTMTPEELTAGEEVTFLTASTGKRERTTLGDLDGDSEKFYLVRRNHGAFGNKTEAGNTWMRESYVGRTVQTMQRVLKMLGVDFTGTVLVETEGAVRRLKLADQGYQPLLPWAYKIIKDNWSKLTSQVDRSPKVKLRDMYRADDYGVLGVLAHHMLLRTPGWEAMEPRLAGHPLLSAVADFVLNANDEAEAADSVKNEVRTLSQYVEGWQLSYSDMDTLSPWDVRRVFSEAYPSTDGLNLQWLIEQFKAEPEKAATLLAMALALDPVREAGTSEQDDAKDQDEDEVQDNGEGDSSAGDDETSSTEAPMPLAA